MGERVIVRWTLIKESGFVIFRNRQVVTAGYRIFFDEILEPFLIVIGLVASKIAPEILGLLELMIWGKGHLFMNPETVLRNARQRVEI